MKQRKTAPFRETLPLARAIEKIVGRHGRRHPATQVFQALRMEVNDELGALEAGFARPDRIGSKPGARIAVISFHSLEDRIVKNFFRDRSRELLDRPEWPEPRPNPEYASASRSRRSRSSRAKTNSEPIRARAARNCASPKKWDEPSPPKNFNRVNARLARALDCDHRFPCADRV